MKKLLYSGLSFILLCGCGGKKSNPDVEVFEFTESFADKLERNDLNSMKFLYPEIMQADSLVNLDKRYITVSQVSPGIYDATLSKDVTLKINLGENGDIKVVESRGLFAFPAQKLKEVKSGAMKNVDLNDVQLQQLIKGGGAKNSSTVAEEGKIYKVNESEPKVAVAEEEPRPTYYDSSDAKNYLLESPSLARGGKQAHFFKGYFADSRGNRYPVKFAFLEQGENVSRTEYLNVGHKARFTFDVWLSGSSMQISGGSRSQSYTCTLYPSGSGSWSGTFTDGGTTLDVYIEPTTSDLFSF